MRRKLKRYCLVEDQARHGKWLWLGRTAMKDPMRHRQKDLPALEKWAYLTMLAKKQLSPAARERFSWVKFYFTKGRKNAIYTAEMYSTNRSTIMKWVKRFNEQNIASLEEKSRGPKHPRGLELTWEQQKRIKELRIENIDYGPKKLKLLYENQYHEEMSLWHMQRVIEKYKLYPLDEKAKTKLRYSRKLSNKTRIHKMKETIKKNHQRFGYLWHIDTVVLYEKGYKRYLYTAIEDYTRIAFSHVYDNHSSRLAAEFLMRLYIVTSGTLQTIHVDNGSEFQGDFEAICKKLGINLIYSRPGTPKDNGKLERFNQTIQKEWLMHSVVGVGTIKDANEDLACWLEKYNFKRPHAAIGYKTPIEFAAEHRSETGTKYPHLT